MSRNFPRLSGAAGLGFVALLIVANLILTSAGFPTPSDAVDVDQVGRIFAAEPGALRLASALLPAAWLLATVFAAGVVATSWTGRAWSLVGLAGVVMQCAVFTGVEASRLALWSAAAHAPAAVPGLWGLHNALFGFNQVFLATALLGLSIGGAQAGIISRWHAGVGLTGAALLFASATASPYGIDEPNPLALLGLAGWLLWLAWIVTFSVTLIRGATPERRPSPVEGRRSGVRGGSTWSRPPSDPTGSAAGRTRTR